MANDTEVKLILTAEDNVSSAVKKVAEVLGNTGLGQAVTAASTAFTALTQAADIAMKAFSAVTSQFSKAIDEASAVETAHKRLALAMLSTGDYTKESFKSITEWGDKIEETIGISDAAAVSLVSTAKNMGLTTEQSKAAAAAAIDMAAATGTSADAAIRQLSMTMMGFAGRLSRTVPEIKMLTKEELQHGEAISFIAKRYAGFAKDEANTFVGAQKRLHEAINNNYEMFGKMIVQNPVVTGAMNKLAEMFLATSKSIEHVSNFVINHSELLKTLGISLGIATATIIAITAAIKAKIVVTTAWTVATLAAKAALTFLTGPVGLVIVGVTALTAAIAAAITHWDKISAVMQITFGQAVIAVSAMLGLLINNLARVVGVFDKQLAAKMTNAIAQMESYGRGLKATGDQALDLAMSSDKMGKSVADAGSAADMATRGLDARLKESVQSMLKLRTEFSKSSEITENIFNNLKAFAPSIDLNDFRKKSKTWADDIEAMKSKAKELQSSLENVIKFSGDKTEITLAKREIAELQSSIQDAEAGLKALKIKNATEIRDTRLKELDIELKVTRMNTVALIDELKMKRIEGAQSLRAELIKIEAERLLQERGLADINLRAGTTIKEAAIMQANDIELKAEQSKYDAMLQLAVSQEDKKQSQILAIRSKLLGSSGVAGAQAGANVEVQQQKEKQIQLNKARQANLINEQEYQTALTESTITATKARFQTEIALHQEKENILGLSEAGLAARLEREQAQFDMELAVLQERLNAKNITIQEYQIAREQAEQAHLANVDNSEQQFYQQQSARYKQMGENWKATLAQMRAEQLRHGQLLGAANALLQSQQVEGTKQAFSNLASLQQTHSKTMFGIGKGAAIAAATINTFQGATKALAEFGPILGPILAATTIIAGMVQVANIKAQKMPSGGQADEGMDSIPQSLHGKSFTLSAGERVVQPEANKDLTKAVDTINSGKGQQGHTINVTVNGNPDASQISQMKEAIIEALRSASERGTPVIHEKGIVRAA